MSIFCPRSSPTSTMGALCHPSSRQHVDCRRSRGVGQAPRICKNGGGAMDSFRQQATQPRFRAAAASRMGTRHHVMGYYKRACGSFGDRYPPPARVSRCAIIGADSDLRRHLAQPAVFFLREAPRGAATTCRGISPPLYNQPSNFPHLDTHGVTWHWYFLPERRDPTFSPTPTTRSVTTTGSRSSARPT